jgi:hypothetical protein
VAYVSDRKDGAVRMEAEQVITKEVEAPKRNARPRTCSEVAVEVLNAEAAGLAATIKKNFEELGV